MICDKRTLIIQSSRDARKESIVTSKTNEKTEAPVKTDLSAQYRPVGLKAVLAAYLMLNSKPKLTEKPA